MTRQLLLTLLLGGCFLLRAGASAGAAPLKVASLSTVLADVARNVGGDRVEVAEIVKAGVDPHEFQPTPGDVEAVASAQLVLISGKGLEGYLAKLEQSVGGAKDRFVDVGGQIGASLKLQEAGRIVEDPHWWHSVANVKRAVGVVRDAFSRAAPGDQDAFKANAANYVRRLDALDDELKLTVAALPRDKRKLVTSHDAFQYLARDYGFKIYPVEGVSTSDEPGSGEVAALLGTIKAQKVKAVFFENMQNPKVIQEITRETGATIGGELYADGLGPVGSDAATYEAMMRHNFNTVVGALK